MSKLINHKITLNEKRIMDIRIHKVRSSRTLYCIYAEAINMAFRDIEATGSYERDVRVYLNAGDIVPVTVSLPEDLTEKVKKLAKQIDISAKTVLREIIEFYALKTFLE